MLSYLCCGHINEYDHNKFINPKNKHSKMGSYKRLKTENTEKAEKIE